MNKRTMPSGNNHSTIIKIISALAAMGFVVMLAIFVLQFVTPSGVGAKITVDQEKIDLGTRVYKERVRAVFTVKNIGDKSLQLADAKIPNQLLEGC